MMLSIVVLAHLWFFMKANLVAGGNKALSTENVGAIKVTLILNGARKVVKTIK